ncbi:MAG: hypothetical protein JXN61_07095 [Sedimentisphaerales bacterium]|nr:hypothetical protein [Sedimentisphaerales bacterium]
MLRQMIVSVMLAACGWACAVRGGPYTEAGVNGYVDPNNHWRHANPLADPGAVINPIFRAWATDVHEYAPSDDEWIGSGVWNDPNKALGPATGDNFDIVSLGDLDAAEIADGVEPGRITLLFNDPIRNGSGYDFAVFENAFVSLYNTAGGSVAGKMLAELGYVDVSSNGVDFVRFPSISLTPGTVGMYGTIEINDIHNLAGKHPNANGLCTGTPFDLSDITADPLVADGTVDINDIRYVRIVDIPGSGDFLDEAAAFIDPTTWPTWDSYAGSHPAYDAWVTFGSGGIDVEAVGVLNEQEYEADIDLNGIVDMFDYTLFASAYGTRFGQAKWIARCNIAKTGGLVVDADDLAVMAGQWLCVEKWRSGD